LLLAYVLARFVRYRPSGGFYFKYTKKQFGLAGRSGTFTKIPGVLPQAKRRDFGRPKGECA